MADSKVWIEICYQSRGQNWSTFSKNWLFIVLNTSKSIKWKITRQVQNGPRVFKSITTILSFYQYSSEKKFYSKKYLGNSLWQKNIWVEKVLLKKIK